MKVRLTSPARADLLSHTDWLLADSPAAADAAMEAILTTLALLSDFPRIGPVDPHGLRVKRVRYGRDGFIIRYEITNDMVVVRRIFHGRQAR
ncbi:type II toxin-antitoxin system RelE/ParE family toxin [Brevundimonas aveniformis]|uniref:type II toxin-antitoxin system RelE/ParE family toxin n=1 Tax=Brevundimonas aveniformis TaxID=370977 RepID=UPI00248F79F1|nr:type II toxin-antitoxin system RelE/ParE family toxin [Brevundimonas aveniformis]